jgi:DNA invertase Pin-like site-specific DNA recombinase
LSHIAYRRVSTVDQNLERQLLGVGVKFDKEFEDKVSGSSIHRPQLQVMLDFVREGDVIHVHSIDRLARNLGDLNNLVKDLTGRGVTVTFHKESLVFSGDGSSPMNELMLNLLGSVYQFERAMLQERQREGIARAKEKGVYKGRPRKVSNEAILDALSSGLSIRKAAKKLGCGVSTVQRVKARQAG